ncbi:thiopurine S-methyltransferase [Alishewanella tabrizica]|uniref:Thiopurine S-methyltransferase n=1 Tax=Alishewanella tabrizica TaxID=671278 RepID=A0ABQ2WKH8_9ALTE|nr:thiopurine S-methyltransferase [Alishewanella tabrizica]GGW55986.1 thiopurine S-methyltransferase [Alishewanella tabrizica]
MNPEFWQEKWQKKDIAFHQAAANPLLIRYFQQLAIAPGGRVFVPLCGKSIDIHWLLSKGYRVVGAELSNIAVQELFSELGLTPTISCVGEVLCYQTEMLQVYVGDIFALSASLIGSIDAIYDRAALVALPITMRQRYAKHLITLSQGAPQLLICFEYDQELLTGPPFSVNYQELHAHYNTVYSLHCVEKNDVEGGLKRQCQATELAWLLKPTETLRVQD